MTARKEHRLADVKILKVQQATLGYTPTVGVSSSDMRLRFEALHVQLEERYDEYGKIEDDEGCAVCDEYQSKIKALLDANMAVVSLSVRSEKSAPTEVMAHSSMNHSSSSPELTTPAIVRATTTDLSTVVLQKRIVLGKSSSNKSWIVEGVLTNVDTGITREVMVKLFDKYFIERAKSEYRIMDILHIKDRDRFITPYGLMYGSKGQIIGHEGEDCSMHIGIAMEKGDCSLRDKVKEGSDLSINDVKLFAEGLLKIIIAAGKVRVVLMDFKLANVVLVFDRLGGVRTKAIDFDCSRDIGREISTETSANYSCPEVASWVVRGCPSSEVPLASSKMDVMAYGFCVYEMATALVYDGKSKTFWENGGVASGVTIDDQSVNISLNNLTDEQVKDNLERTFVGVQYGSLRSFLEHALYVSPEARSTAEWLLNNRSFLGGIDRTVDQKGFIAEVNYY